MVKLVNVAAAMTEPTVFKYRAFLSYSHADTKRAKWLHGRLESFPIDKELIGRETSTGPIPKSLQADFPRPGRVHGRT